MGEFFLANEDLRKKLKVLMLSIIALILLIVLSIALYLLWGYYKIESSFAAREKLAVPAKADAGSVSETGYICYAKTVTCIKNRTKRLYWWVKIAASKKRYLCEWQYGFSGFKKDDAVTFIHQNDRAAWPEDLTGYLIGRQGQLKDQPACVALHGVDASDY